MKICLFADSESIHTQRWCRYFVDLGHDVHLISFKNKSIPDVNCHFVSSGKIDVSGGNWRVLLEYKKVKRIINQIKPDIFHAHYATSYGITGALCNYHPYVVTALGSDVLISPKQSKIIRFLLKRTFKRADWITSMAEHMTKELEDLVDDKNKITTLPFGIDTSVFYETKNRKAKEDFTIISTRNFENVYNIEHLLYAFQKASIILPHIKLVLIGDGSKRGELELLVNDLNIEHQVVFKGKISQQDIAIELNKAHLFVSVSKSDGNNISLNEAMACGTFCIATNILANVQWIIDNQNGFLVEIDDVDSLAERIIYAYNNYDELQSVALPINRRIIAEKADWYSNMSIVIKKYNEIISRLK